MDTILYLSVPLKSVDDLMRITETAEAIVAKYYGQLRGAGAGFGCRDMDWLFLGDDDLAVEHACEELRAAFPDAAIELEPAEDDEEDHDDHVWCYHGHIEAERQRLHAPQHCQHRDSGRGQCIDCGEFLDDEEAVVDAHELACVRIAELLDGTAWNADTLELIAAELRKIGYRVGEPKE